MVPLLLAGTLMLAAGAAHAHPHVWITATSELLYAPDGSFTGVRHAWTFDDMFSAYALQGIETKAKGVYTREELAPLAQTNAELLKEPNGWSALHYAARNGNVEIVQALLNAGADANYAGSMDGKANSAMSKPLALAQGMLDVVTVVQPSEMEAKLRANGLDDPALVKSATDPKAAERYQKVVELLRAVTK